MTNSSLTKDYALVLRLIDENDYEDITYLADMLGISKDHLHHVLRELHQKKLVHMDLSEPYAWVSISSQGKLLIGTLLYESNFHT